MLTKLQFQTLFGFKPERRSASKSGKKIAKKSNKVGTRMIKGVKRTVYKGKNGGKFYKKSNGRKVYFGPAMALAKSFGVKGAVKVIGAKAVEGAGYTLGYKAANVGVSMLKKSMKKKKSSKMGRKKIVAGKKRTVYKSASGAKYYKSAKGNKVYFGGKATTLSKSPPVRAASKSPKKSRGLKPGPFKKLVVLNGELSIPKFGKKRKASRRNTRFGNHGNATLSRSMGPAPIMFGSHIPNF